MDKKTFNKSSLKILTSRGFIHVRPLKFLLHINCYMHNIKQHPNINFSSPECLRKGLSVWSWLLFLNKVLWKTNVIPRPACMHLYFYTILIYRSFTCYFKRKIHKAVVCIRLLYPYKYSPLLVFTSKKYNKTNVNSSGQKINVTPN